MTDAPTSVAELLARSRRIEGLCFQDAATQVGYPLPKSLRRKKGAVGELTELLLGADAGNQDGPDFVQLGVELKTLPLDAEGMPLESTYVAACPVEQVAEQAFVESRVYRKLRLVFFQTLQADKSIELADRRFGRGFLFNLRESFAFHAIKQDWETIVTEIATGNIQGIDASVGQYLQLRPKASDSRVMRLAPDGQGGVLRVNPRGFYLRRAFVAEVWRRQLEEWTG